MRFHAALIVSLVLISSCGGRKSILNDEQTLSDSRGLDASVSRVSDEHSRLADEIGSWNESLEGLSGRIFEMAQTRLKMEALFQVQLDVQTKSLLQSRQELAQLRTALAHVPTPDQENEIKIHINQLERRSRDREREIADLQQLMATAEQGDDAVARKLASQVLLAQSSLDIRLGTLKELEAASRRMTAELMKLQDTNRKLQDSARMLQMSVVKLQQRLGQAGSKVTQLDSSLFALHQRFQNLTSAYGQAQSELGRTKLGLVAAKASGAELQVDLATLRLKYRELENTNKALEAEVQQAKEEKAQAKAEADQACSELERLQREARASGAGNAMRDPAFDPSAFKLRQALERKWMAAYNEI